MFLLARISGTPKREIICIGIAKVLDIDLQAILMLYIFTPLQNRHACQQPKNIMATHGSVPADDASHIVCMQDYVQQPDLEVQLSSPFPRIRHLCLTPFKLELDELRRKGDREMIASTTVIGAEAMNQA